MACIAALVLQCHHATTLFGSDHRARSTGQRGQARQERRVVAPVSCGVCDGADAAFLALAAPCTWLASCIPRLKALGTNSPLPCPGLMEVGRPRRRPGVDRRPLCSRRGDRAQAAVLTIPAVAGLLAPGTGTHSHDYVSAQARRLRSVPAALPPRCASTAHESASAGACI